MACCPIHIVYDFRKTTILSLDCIIIVFVISPIVTTNTPLPLISILSMPDVSVFQCLPLHIAKAIVGYCISQGVSRGDYYDGVEAGKHVWSTMHHLSYFWHLLALQHFFERLTIDISTGTGAAQFKYANLPQDIKITSTPSYNYVKRVDINFSDARLSQTNRTSKDFSTAWPEDLVLPSARRLSVDIHGLLYQTFDDNKRFYWIAQRILTSLPKLEEVVLSDPLPSMEYTDRSNVAHTWKAGEFLTTIFERSKAFHIRLHAICLLDDSSSVRGDTGLTRITCFSLTQNDLFFHVVEHSVQTLESLECSITLDNIGSLVTNSKGQPIVYPRLKSLALHYHTYSEYSDNKLQLDASVSPFPVLQHLKWTAPWVFRDDILFRGNEGTLESLDLVTNSDCVDILQRYRTFTNGRFSRLAYVSLREIDHEFSSHPNSDESYVRFATTLITPASLSLLLDHELKDPTIINVVSAHPHSANIQLLDLSETVLSLTEICGIISLFPNLAQFGCKPTGVDGPMPWWFLSDINALYARYYPLSHCLKYLSVVQGIGDEIELVVLAVIALSILCPSFVKAFVSPYEKDHYNMTLKLYTNSRIYAQHRPAVQRLLRMSL